MARRSSRVTRGLPRTFSNSSSLRVIGNCWMLNESAPAWFRIACFTDALSPWISDTTAIIEVTATMLPRTVMNDRSFADQMASSAMSEDSQRFRILPFQPLLPVQPFLPFLPLPPYLLLLLSTFTRSPSAIPRTELYGPV